MMQKESEENNVVPAETSFMKEKKIFLEIKLSQSKTRRKGFQGKGRDLK